MTRRYAEETTVTSEKSRGEIERTLSRYGADQFFYGWEGPQAVVGFRAHGRIIRFRLPLPDRRAKEFTHTPTHRFERSPAQAEAAYDQAVRQRWRALALVIKAKLEAVTSGIVTFEDEFLAQILMPDGSTVSEWTSPEIEKAYTSGLMPKLLPALPAGGKD